MQTENKESTFTVQDVINGLLEKNPDGGEININALEKQLSHLSRSEIIHNLRKSNSGAFVTGRRGKPSRFVYGAPAIGLLHKEPNQSKRSNSPDPEHSDSGHHGIELRVNVGGQITTIPIKLELGVAA